MATIATPSLTTPKQVKMAKRKTVFDVTNVTVKDPVGSVSICNYEGEINVCVMVKGSNNITTGGHMRAKDLETFALNILKSLKSKHLKQ